jgi:hypothetical protein
VVVHVVNELRRFESRVDDSHHRRRTGPGGTGIYVRTKPLGTVAMRVRSVGRRIVERARRGNGRVPMIRLPCAVKEIGVRRGDGIIWHRIRIRSTETFDFVHLESSSWTSRGSVLLILFPKLNGMWHHRSKERLLAKEASWPTYDLS